MRWCVRGRRQDDVDPRIARLVEPTGAAPRPSAVIEWAIGSARRATTGSLPSVLQDVLTTAPAKPRLLDELELVPAIGTTPPAIETPAAAASSLRVARTWLWQHPNLVHAVHLRRSPGE